MEKYKPINQFTLQDCERFLESNPGSPYEDEVRQQYEKLLEEQRKNDEVPDPLVPSPKNEDKKVKWYKRIYRWFHKSKLHKTLWILILLSGLYVCLACAYIGFLEYVYIDRVTLIGTRDGFFSEGKIEVEKNDLFGYMDKTGKIIIEPKFKEARHFNEGLAPVSSNGATWGFINDKGDFVINDKYLDVHSFSEGLAAVFNGEVWGFVDKHGNVLIKPQFHAVSDFHEGLAAVQLEDGGHYRWGFIDKKGDMVIEPIYSNACDFHEGLAAVESRGKGYYWGFVDKQGNMVIEPKYSSVCEGLGSYEYRGFHKGFALVADSRPFYSSSDAYYIDKQGNKVDENIHHNRYYPENNHIYCERDKSSGLWGFRDANGEWVIKPRYKRVKGFGEGTYIVTLPSEKIGVVDESGKIIVEAKYCHCGYERFNEGLIVLEKQIIGWFVHKVCVINREGEEIFSKYYLGA